MSATIFCIMEKFRVQLLNDILHDVSYLTIVIKVSKHGKKFNKERGNTHVYFKQCDQIGRFIGVAATF